MKFQVGRIYTKRDDAAAILADGQTMIVRTMQRDAAVCPTCDNTGKMKAGIRCPDCGGKNLDTGGQLTDAETQMRTHIARDSAWRAV
jgi:hypothetical protein